MPWHSLRGHDRVVRELRAGLEQGRLPHALLFVGPEGIGKRAFALRLAQALLCERVPEAKLDPCGACPSCLQVMAGSHPDVHQVRKPDDKNKLSIEVIRDLNVELGLKPSRGSRKVAIVDDADDLNVEAANAFLKTLEEPAPGSVLILVGTSAEIQLDTLVSRCRVVRFDPLPDAELAAVLLEQRVVDTPEDAARLARLGEGSVARARGLAEPALASFRRELIHAMASPRGFDPSLLARKVDAFVKEAGKDGAAKRDRARLVIGEMARIFRGLIWRSAGLEAPSPDPADREAVGHLADRVGPDAALTLSDRCVEADYQVGRNVSMPILLEALMHDVGHLTNPRPR
ncbi:DNA polymerase III subunit delta' [Tundrisphaera sp. TA3]|uniref:DNA polymerase III subunit delta' n=1 Tax=Tundrisphaera sp. TA3 TaxID=3435775 RepID=UPI003EB981DF